MEATAQKLPVLVHHWRRARLAEELTTRELREGNAEGDVVTFRVLSWHATNARALREHQ